MARRIVIDLDHTLTLPGFSYDDARPDGEVVRKLQEYRDLGFEIVVSTSRNVRTYSGNIGKINKHTLPNIVKWLDEQDIPYDEIYVGKPWCGEDGFYVDDRSIRPDEFVKLSYEDVKRVIGIFDADE